MNRGMSSLVWMGVVLSAGFTLAGCSPKTPSGSGGMAAHSAPNTTSTDGAAVTDKDAPLASPEALAHAAASPAPTSPAADTPAASPPAATPVKLDGDTATLGPDNTKILFVGTHKPPKKPDPRTGGFEKFSGKLAIDPANKTLKSLNVEIETASVWTEFDKLTDHLKNADFLEVNAFPTIKFESTQIEPGDAPDQVKVRGNLTLHGVTKEITAPAAVKIDDSGVTLTCQFDFNRTDYGMNLVTDDVEEKVSINVVVGEKTAPTKAAEPA